MLTAGSFFQLDDFTHKEIFTDCLYVWESLDCLQDYIKRNIGTGIQHVHLRNGMALDSHYVYFNGKLRNARECIITWANPGKCGLKVWENGQYLHGASVIMAGAVIMGQQISLGKGVLVESGAMIKEPAIIGDCCEIRQGAYLRGNCLLGERCVVGHTTEVKHSIFLNDAKAGHFAYLGDSILGNDVNLGAGTKCANLRFLSGNIQIRAEGQSWDTGRRKIGAILGDQVQTGCNSVTSPGTLLGPRSLVLPNVTARSGLHPPDSVIS